MAAAIPANDPRLHPDTGFVGKFALDVILYNLQACGCPVRFVVRNPPGCVYSRPNFVRIAAASVLRLCLTYRDKWKPNITQLAKNVSKYDAEFFSKCLVHIVKRAQTEGKEALQLNVEITLALTTEMALYLISEGRKFELMDLIGPTTTNIMLLIEPPLERAVKFMYSPNSPLVNFKQELEKLFNEFENIWELLDWIENFIRGYAIPYGSRGDLSAIFYREVGERWKGIVERVYRGEKPSDEAVIINLGFLPREAYNSIKAETSVPMPKYSEVAWGRRKQSSASGSGSKQTAQAGSSGKDSSKQTAKGGQSGKDSSNQASQGGEGGKDSSKQTAQSRKKKKGSSKQATQGAQSGKDSSEETARGAQSGKDSSEETARGAQSGKDSSEKTAQGAQSGKDSSEETAQGAQSGKDSSDPGLVEAISQIDLGSEEKSQASQGAIRKRRGSKK